MRFQKSIRFAEKKDKPVYSLSYAQEVIRIGGYLVSQLWLMSGI